MAMKRMFALAVLVGLVALPPGQAAEMKHFKVGSWEAGAYSDDSLRNKFSHCAGSASYKSGLVVTLIINREYKWGVAFANPKWNLKAGLQPRSGLCRRWRRAAGDDRESRIN